MKRRCQRKLKTAKTDTGSVENDTAGYLNRKNKNQLNIKKNNEGNTLFPISFRMANPFCCWGVCNLRIVLKNLSSTL